MTARTAPIAAAYVFEVYSVPRIIQFVDDDNGNVVGQCRMHGMMRSFRLRDREDPIWRRRRARFSAYSTASKTLGPLSFNINLCFFGVSDGQCLHHYET